MSEHKKSIPSEGGAFPKMVAGETPELSESQLGNILASLSTTLLESYCTLCVGWRAHVQSRVMGE